MKNQCCDKCTDSLMCVNSKCLCHTSSETAQKCHWCDKPDCELSIYDHTPTDTMEEWQSHIDLIWERAHIPEWANDAKHNVKSFITNLLEKERKNKYRMTMPGDLVKMVQDMAYKEGAQVTLEGVRGIVEEKTNAIIAKLDSYDKGPFARAFCREMLKLNSSEILSALDTDKS